MSSLEYQRYMYLYSIFLSQAPDGADMTILRGKGYLMCVVLRSYALLIVRGLAL